MVASLDGLLRRLPGVPALWRINIVVFVQGHGSSRQGRFQSGAGAKTPKFAIFLGIYPHMFGSRQISKNSFGDR